MSQIVIEFMSGSLDGQTVTLQVSGEERDFTLGRAEDCDVVIPHDDLVSSHHARLTVRGGECTLEDTASRNGTFLDDGNAQVIGSVPLPDRTLFRVGRTRLRVREIIR